jgi:hypothetical protein
VHLLRRRSGPPIEPLSERGLLYAALSHPPARTASPPGRWPTAGRLWTGRCLALEGDLDGLVARLAPDVVMVGDGGKRPGRAHPRPGGARKHVVERGAGRGSNPCPSAAQPSTVTTGSGGEPGVVTAVLDGQRCQVTYREG